MLVHTALLQMNFNYKELCHKISLTVPYRTGAMPWEERCR